MTIDSFTPPAPITIAGTGPYGFNQPYAQGALQASVLNGAALVALVPGTDFAVSPAASDTGGNVTLSAAAAATHAGRQLILIRDSAPEQGWAAVQGGREAGLEAQLDAMAMALQDLREAVRRTVRLPRAAAPVAPEAGRIIAFDAGGNPVLGPTVDDIEDAVAAAATAQAAAALAQAAAAIAQSAEASLLRDAGNWTTATAYRPSDLVTQAGSTYICQIAHTSGTFSTDLSANRWRVFAAQGASGTGSGNVIAANNGSEFPDKAQFRTNVGLGAAADVQFRSALLAGTAPGLALRETDGNTGWNTSRWVQDGNALALVSESQAGAVLSTDLRIEKGAGGATRIVLSLGGVERLSIEGGQTIIGGTVIRPGEAGEIFFWADDAPPPHGLVLDGSILSRTAYARLFARWGTRFGAGNGTTTFGIPDARGLVPRGLDLGRGLDPGRTLGSFQDDAIRNIIGSWLIWTPNFDLGPMAFGPTGAFTSALAGATQDFTAQMSSNDRQATQVNFDASRVVPVAAENRVRSIAWLPCVRY
jgi:hypothetical protein